MGLRVVFVLAAVGIVQCELLNSCTQTVSFVDGHNARRLRLAKGEVSGQPGASKMTYVVWDEELATKARNWASRNEFRHNPNKSIPSGRFKTGENIYYYGTTDRNFKFNPDMAMQMWWDEHKSYTYKPLSQSDFSRSPETGHYTQMAWDKTLRIGCGISKYYKNNMIYFLVVCDYGPAGNIFGQKPYNSDHGASGRLQCGESDCHQKYGSHC